MTSDTYSLSITCIGNVQQILTHATRAQIVDCILNHVNHIEKTLENYPRFLVFSEDTGDLALKIPVIPSLFGYGRTLFKCKFNLALNRFKCNLENNTFNPTVEVK